MIPNPNAAGNFAAQVANLGDTDGDGQIDVGALSLGCNDEPFAGAVYTYFGLGAPAESLQSLPYPGPVPAERVMYGFQSIVR